MIPQVLMKGLLEGIVVIALFILTPVIVVWVLIAITRATKRNTS
jgi:chromate transport protein ChrA